MWPRTCVGYRRPLAGRVHGLVLEQQAAVGNLVGHAPGVYASLQIPAGAVLHEIGAEAKVDKLTHFSQLTLGHATARPARAQASRLPAQAAPSRHAAGRRTMRP